VQASEAAVRRVLLVDLDSDPGGAQLSGHGVEIHQRKLTIQAWFASLKCSVDSGNGAKAVGPASCHQRNSVIRHSSNA
jgi:hypothetical protein